MTEEPDRPAPLESPRRRERRRLPRLPLAVRILLFIAGWSLLLIGVAGLVLPGIQGILTILAGAAVLSVVSETVYRLLKKALRRRWPRLWKKIRGLRRKVHEKFSGGPTQEKPEGD